MLVMLNRNHMLKSLLMAELGWIETNNLELR